MDQMTSRERVLAALRYEEPDRVPLDLGGLSSTIETVPYNDLKKYLGLKHETKIIIRDHVEPDQEILDMFEIDTRYIRMKPPNNFKTHIEPDNSYVDEWGTRWKKPVSSLYWDPVEFPFKDATIEDLETYPWPDPDDPGRVDGLREEVKRLREETNCAIIADEPFSCPFENGCFVLRGPEQFLLDMAMNRQFVKTFLEKLTDLTIRFYQNYLDAVGDYIDIVMVSDDLGTNEGPFFSMESYRELVKPYQKRYWNFIKQNTDAYLFLHSCGSVYYFIPDFIELGVDILNPVQVSAKNMDSKKLKTEFGDKITFWGGIDTQQVLPFGTLEDVENEVKKRISDFAPGGGYILTAVHDIQAGVSPEKICRMYEAVKKYGKYPINL